MMKIFIFLIFFPTLSTTLNCPDEICSCNPIDDGFWYISCTEILDYFSEAIIELTFNPARGSIKINCNGHSLNISNLLQRLDINEKVSAINFDDCHMPEVPFANYLPELRNLTELYFSSATNSPLNSITSEMFRGLESLKKLGLDDNDILDIPEDLLIFTPQLIFLDLKGNRLNSLPSNLFKSASKLETISLAANRLRDFVEPLGDLPKLKTLHLYNNDLVNISRAAFSGLSELMYLDLQGNNLSKLPSNVFDDLPLLQELRLYSNILHQIPSDLLQYNTKLRLLDLQDNPILEIPDNLISNHGYLQSLNLSWCNLSSISPDFFRGVVNLTDVKLSHNHIHELDANLFNDTIQLIYLRLDHNQLTTIPQNSFQNQKNLEELHLNNNFLTTLPNRTFNNLEQLRILDLSNNQLIELNSPFKETKLVKLHLNHNNLTSISRDAFIPCVNLNYLDLSYNLIDFIDFQLPQHLVKFDISHNSLLDMPQTWQPWIHNVNILNLSHNHIEKISAPNLQFHSAGAEIDLRYNNISIVDLSLGKVLTTVEFSDKPIARLGFNPVHCDCKMSYLLTHMKYQSQERRVAFRLDVENLTCAQPFSLKKREVLSLSENELYCKITKNCPLNCHCSFRAEGSVTEVNCPPNSIDNVPLTAPFNTTILNLTGNNITNLDNYNLSYWNNLSVLILTDNLLTTLDVNILPSNLQSLYLDGNRLQRLTLSTLESLSSRPNLQLWLGLNPWICECDDPLEPWLESTPNVKDAYKMDCKNVANTTVGQYKCPEVIKGNTNILISVVAVSIILTAFVSFAGIAFYKYNHQLKVWLYSHGWCLWLLSEKDVDAGKQYDAFISFSQDDIDWVARELLPGLEQHEPHYRVCIHHRDWLVGEWIPDQIVRSVEESCRTIVVLSSNFLQSVWGRLEFRAAHQQALKDRMNRVIVVVLGEVPPQNEMDPEMRMYVGLKTYLKWEDPWFWKKLRYAMPHKSALSIPTSLPSNNRSSNKKFGDFTKILQDPVMSNSQKSVLSSTSL